MQKDLFLASSKLLKTLSPISPLIIFNSADSSFSVEKTIAFERDYDGLESLKLFIYPNCLHADIVHY